jgi:hypothetical protein
LIWRSLLTAEAAAAFVFFCALTLEDPNPFFPLAP